MLLKEGLTLNTLCDGDDNNPPLSGLLEEIQNVGAIGGHVAGTIALEYHTLDGWVEKVGHGVAPDGGEEAQEYHVAIEGRVHAELQEEQVLSFRSWFSLSSFYLKLDLIIIIIGIRNNP